MERKRTLLAKYDIPINHLDFVYIRDCADAREMEKIVQILRSGEEGYYPDLTKCAEDKLHELKPNSRLFRYEEQLRKRDALSTQDWKPIYDWTHDIKTKDNKLLVAGEQTATAALDLVPVRKSGSIQQQDADPDAVAAEGQLNPSTSANSTAKPTNKPEERIKSTDYGKWDKYDADEECLRMDLAVERIQEEVERKNRLNLQKSQPQIVEVHKEPVKEREIWSKLTEVEREKLAEEYRLRGNDCFRAKEYDNAVKEYSRVINMSPETAAAAYNNRAAAQIKLQKFPEAIEDCQCCLNVEPENVKARLRLAEATYAYGRKRESYELYQKVLEIDAQNVVALKATRQLRTLFGELPPPTATRIQIQEDKTKKVSTSTKSSQPKTSAIKSKGEPKSGGSTASISKPQKQKVQQEYDLADLVVPNRVVKNKFATAAEAFSNLKVNNAAKGQQQQQQQQQKQKKTTPLANILTRNPSLESELRLPTANENNNRPGRILIEEI